MQNEKTLLAAIEEQESLAQGGGRLSEERRAALDHYLGRPYGDEEEGRSQVVMRDVADTIEWIKPSLLKIFCSGDEVAKFEAVGPEDEKQAEQETDYINYILQQKNNGFLLFHDWFHDALLQKTGYVWAQAVEDERQDRQNYQGLLDDEFALILQNQELEVLEHEARQVMGPGGMPLTVHDAVVVERTKYACIKTKNVPPERVAVASDWADVNFVGCPFLRVVEYPTISELRQAGYDVDDDISDNGGEESDKWDQARRNLDESDMDEEDVGADAATRRVRTRYVWMQYDWDKDGIAELRHLVIVGNTVLLNEESDLIPVAAITPSRLPHEHYGLSIDDVVNDLQRIRTVLIRGFLDNMYLANNGRNVVDATTINLDDLLTVRPGGVVRNNGPVGAAIAPLIHPQIGSDIMSAVEYVDTVRENRTGVTKYNQGLDANTLNKTKGGIDSIMNASQQRIELIARVFAETGVKQLMLIVHALSLKHTRKAELIKLRNDWVQVDPSSWKTRCDITVTVGIGTGNKDQQAGHLLNMWQMQLAGLQFGIATPQNLYATAVKTSQNAGFRQPELFWSDPAKMPPQPPQPSPEQVKAQAEAQKVQFQAQHESQMKDKEIQADAWRFQAEQQTQMAVDANRQEWEARQKQLELEQQAQLEALRIQGQKEIEAMRLSFERWKVEYQEQQKAEIARMGMAKDMAQHNDNMNQNERHAQREDARFAQQQEKDTDE